MKKQVCIPDLLRGKKYRDTGGALYRVLPKVVCVHCGNVFSVKNTRLSQPMVCPNGCEPFEEDLRSMLGMDDAEVLIGKHQGLPFVRFKMVGPITVTDMDKTRQEAPLDGRSYNQWLSDLSNEAKTGAKNVYDKEVLRTRGANQVEIDLFKEAMKIKVEEEQEELVIPVMAEPEPVKVEKPTEPVREEKLSVFADLTWRGAKAGLKLASRAIFIY